MKWLLALACGVLAALPALVRADDASGWSVSPAGRTIFKRFTEAPYPYASRAQGHSYDGKTFDFANHYNDNTVGLFVPSGFTPAAQGVDFIVHFHGWNNHVARVLDFYRLREQVEASGVNAVLVVPQGPYDAPDSDDGKLQHEPGAFAALLAEVADFLQEQGVIRKSAVRSVVLTAHSGGYQGLSAVLKIGGDSTLVTDVALFDAAYGNLDGFAGWLETGVDHRLVSLFTDDTISGNVELLSMLQAQASTSRVLMQTGLTRAVLNLRGGTFVYTPDIPHDEIMQRLDYYELFLATSALPRR